MLWSLPVGEYFSFIQKQLFSSLVFSNLLRLPLFRVLPILIVICQFIFSLTVKRVTRWYSVIHVTFVCTRLVMAFNIFRQVAGYVGLVGRMSLNLLVSCALILVAPWNQQSKLTNNKLDCIIQFKSQIVLKPVGGRSGAIIPLHKLLCLTSQLITGLHMNGKDLSHMKYIYRMC